MKKIIPVFLFAGFFLFSGCGSDDKGNGPTPVPTLIADTTVSAPSMTDVNDPVWQSVQSISLDISGANTPKLGVPKETVVSDSVTVQAINKNDSLYLRIKWGDPDLSVWRDNFEITAVGPPILFKHNDILEQEDQLYVMFDGGTSFGWDVWNWRSLTTGTGGLAEGFTYKNNTLTTDAGNAAVATQNNRFFGAEQPTYVHRDTSEFNGYIFDINLRLDFLNDTTTYGNKVNLSTGWSVGQKIPGWMIDFTLKDTTTLADGRRNSRFDIFSASTYNVTLNEYTVVLRRALNTGKTDDVDLSALNSVTAKIGVFNNQEDFNLGSNNRGFTVSFNFVLQ